VLRVTVAELCRSDPEWNVIEVDDRGRWQRVERVLSTTSVFSRVVVLSPQRRVNGSLIQDPHSHTQVQGLMLSPDGVIVDETLGTEESVVATVTRWMANLRAGRTYNARPLSLMNFYADRAWTPPGERLHVLLTPSPTFADRITTFYGEVLEQWSGALRIVPRERLHITLAWLDNLPSAELADDAIAAACVAVENVLSTVSWTALAELEVLAADARPYGVRCEVDRPRPIKNLSAAVRAALAEVWPDATVKPTSSGAHVALAYSATATAEGIELRDQLGRAGVGNPLSSDPDTWRVGPSTVNIVHVDTFGADPWRWNSVASWPR
jgi:2'-5' RNA ligase